RLAKERGPGRGGGVGGAPPPRSGIGVLPHFPPQRDPTCTFPPTYVHDPSPGRAEKRRKAGAFAVGGGGAPCGEPVQERVRSSVLHASLPLPTPFRPGRVPPWGAVGYPSIDLRGRWTRLLRCVA